MGWWDRSLMRFVKYRILPSVSLQISLQYVSVFQTLVCCLELKLFVEISRPDSEIPTWAMRLSCACVHGVRLYVYIFAAHYIRSRENSSFFPGDVWNAIADLMRTQTDTISFWVEALCIGVPPWGRLLSALRPRFPGSIEWRINWSMRRVLSSFWSLWKQGIFDGTFLFGELQLQSATSPSALLAQRFWLLGLLRCGRERGRLFLHVARKRKLYCLHGIVPPC